MNVSGATCPLLSPRAHTLHRDLEKALSEDLGSLNSSPRSAGLE